MALEDLTRYIRDQASQINRNPACFSEAEPAWAALKDSLWGKGLVSLTLPPSVMQGLVSLENHEHLPNVAPTTHPVMEIPESMPQHIWGLKGEQTRILVRPEYVESEQAAVLANTKNADMFLVTGQPGIGKSIFLIWMLMRRLALRLPTGLQTDKDTVLLFHEGGVSKFQHLNNPIYYGKRTFPTSSPAGRIWVLVDSTCLFEPAPIFCTCGGPFFVVGAVSSCQKRQYWTTKVLAEPFYMKTWPFAEALQLLPFLRSDASPCTQQRLWYLYNTCGASPRALAWSAYDPDWYESLLLDQVERISPEALQHAFQSPDSDRFSDLIAVVEPSPGSRRTCEKRVASQPVFRMLWDRHIKHRVSDIRFYYDLFRGSPNTAFTAGSIFQLWVRELLRRGGPFRIFPIRGHCATTNFVYNDYTASNERRDQRDLELPGSGEHLFVEGDKFCVGQYFIDHPDVDAGASPPILLTFHITRNKEYDLDVEDLRRINGLNFSPHSNICKYLVVVTPDDIQPEIRVPKTFFEGEEEAPEDLFSMFHYPVSMK